MTIASKRNTSFPLRLAISLKDLAGLLAQEDGVSLNHFINLAVAEKVSRIESEALKEHKKLVSEKAFFAASEVMSNSFSR